MHFFREGAATRGAARSSNTGTANRAFELPFEGTQASQLHRALPGDFGGPAVNQTAASASLTISAAPPQAGGLSQAARLQADGAPAAFAFPALPDVFASPASQQGAARSAPQENGSLSLTALATATGDARIDGLLGGTKWTTDITYADTDSASDYQSGYFSDTGNGVSAQNEGFSQFTSQQMKALHSALGSTFYNQQSSASVAFSVSSFTNLGITYAGAGNGNATIRVANSNDPGTAYAYYPDDSIYGGDSFFGNFYDPYPVASLKTPVAGNYAWYTYLHEMGHSLGLKHSQELGGVANVAVPFDYDNSEFTVMSYRSYAGAPINYIHFGPWGAPQSYMMLDIAALQTLYGADYTVNSGNTTYSWAPGSGNTLVDGQIAIAPGANVIFATIWDGGGTDTYDLSAYTTDLQIDLAPGSASLFSAAQASNLGDGRSARGNIYNALTAGGSNASLIENAIGGSGNDTIKGNDAINTLKGEGGNDRLDGGAGADILVGGTGDDTYIVDNSGDQVVELLGGGTDTVYSSANFNLAGTYVETLYLLGTAIAATGNSQNNSLYGNASNNTLTGLGGDDRLEGGAGADTMVGGIGNDTYLVDNAGDLVIEGFGEGYDTVLSSVNYTLTGTYVELLQLTGAAITAIGNSQANTLIGNTGANTLTGLAGDDSLDGGTGADTMIGGTGNDTYYVDNAGDVVTELFGEGTDTIYSAIDYTLAGTYVELLQLAGTAVSATGNSQANTLIGNAGANTLTGLGGDDYLDGSLGADTMAGGTGNDTYLVDNAGDTVIELFGEGNDTIVSSINFNLAGLYVEALQLKDAAVTAIGNSLNNTLTGNGLANTLTGLGGDDILDGRLGADTMTGGIGDDTYFVDNAGDVVIELFGQGTDTINSSINFNLAGLYVENLVLSGAAVAAAGNTLSNKLTGNALANTLTGLGGDDILDGKLGADTMTGGTGDDTYYVDNAGDLVVELFGQGTDTVYSSVNFSLAGLYVEKLELTGTAVSATGNSLANSLFGNAGANTLSGLGGDDVLDGGLGADSLSGGSGADTFVFDTAIGPANIDTITDFSVPDDTIQLDRTVFTALAAGVLGAGAFVIGAAAVDAFDRIIYNSATGALLYDTDGTGGNTAIQFATLSTGLALTNADFFVV